MNKYVKEVITNFDFERVHMAMKALKWTWWDSKSDDGVPSTSELVMHATDMLNRAYKADHDTYKITCGGFVASKDGDTLRLAFEVSNWEAYMGEEDND